MSRDLRTLGFVLFLGALSPGGAAGDQYGIRAPGTGSLSVVDGKALLTKGPIYDANWELSWMGKESTTSITISSSKWPGWGLAYDPTGKDPAVTLAPPGRGERGKQWRVVDRGASGYTIQAAEGKYKGWYLDIQGKGEVRRNTKGERYTAYRLVLTEKPKRPLHFKINEISR
jgi:hypothetical protein